MQVLRGKKEYSSDTGFYAGEGTEHEVFIRQEKRAVRGIGKWRLVKVESAQEVRPIHFSRDTGERAKYSGSPAATVKKYGKGLIAGIYGPVFGSYSYSHYPGIRSFVAEIIKVMNTGRLVEVDAPASIAITLREKESRIMLHMVNLGSSQPLSPRNTIIEDIPAVGPVEVTMNMEKTPESVFVVPGSQPVRWNYAKGVSKAHLSIQPPCPIRKHK